MAEYLKRFEFEIQDTPMEKMLKTSPARLSLYDEYLTWTLQFDFEAKKDMPDDDLVAGQQAYRYNNAFILKSKISGTMVLATKSGNWVLNIYHSTDFISIWFPKDAYDKCKEAKYMVDNWLLGNYDVFKEPQKEETNPK